MLKSTVGRYTDFGVPTEPEVFPKQSSIQHGCFGNWLRLLGRHPKRGHWSCVWGGDKWLSGREAIELVLGLEGVSPKTPKQTHCMCLNWNPQLEEAVVATLPTGPGQRNRRVFGLARRLKALMPDAKHERLRAIVEDWHHRALPVIRTQAFTETWSDFVVAWQRVQVPFGSSLEAIVESARAKPTPQAALKYDMDEVRELVSICFEMQRFCGTGPFFLGCRTAGKMIGASKDKAARLMKMLVFDGVLELVTPGSRGTMKATEYRCLIR